MLAIYTDLLPVLLFLLLFSRIKNKRIVWVLVLYLLFDFLANLSLLYIIPLRFHNYIYPIFTLVESLFFAGFLYAIIKKQALRKLVVAITAVFSILLIAYYYYTYFFLQIQSRPVLDSIPIGIETILIFVFSLFYFFEQMNDTTNLFIYSKPAFWAVLGILLYLSGSFFIYIFANQIDFKDLGKYWIITNISVLIRNIFFAVAIYIQANQSKKKSSKKNYNLYPPKFIDS